MSCPKCVEGYELPGQPTGTIQPEYQGAYFAPRPENGQKDVAAILLTDAFGLPLKNCKLMADKIAAQVGCDVWVPDLFQGPPILPLNAMNLPDRADQRPTILDWFRFIFGNIIPALPRIIRNRSSVVDAKLASFVALLKETKSYEKFGAVGYCFGGSVAIRLASTNLINTVVVVHPGSFSISEVRAMGVPSSWAWPEVDVAVSPQKILEAEAALASKKVANPSLEYEFKEYPGTQHGFAARPNLKYPEIVEAHEKALEQTISWFKKTLLG
ncbi:dienelactone hydrolase endo-1,3,1,4-beta-D-glucanase [Ephemerocybe angulata]|uniref:Dienelactone hydrolase endo-1,3,1,4-beta-D-glucanase n=1 Tax=Ephemerocybe angulata TaxID=980116 RepID=A0A8H6I5Z4_9AGAR|nr:dienelactone hydrolase endo-1,3,1,4-beta-D-glucanase [Tulosesus angulatus]